MSIAFVAGATGHTGREVVAALRAREVRTIAHVRHDSPELAKWAERFVALGAELDTTPWTADEMKATFARLLPTHVFGLLGTTKSRAKREAGKGVDPKQNSYEVVDVGYTLMLLAASKALDPHPRFVYLSSAGTKEGTGNAYLAARAKVERALRESMVPYTIARPSIIAGDREEKRTGEAVAAKAADALLGVAGALGARHLRDRWASTDNVTLAKSLVRHAFDAASIGQVIESEGLRA